MKKTAKLTAMILALIMVGSSVTACSKDEDNPGKPDFKQGETDGGESESAEPVILTGIYKGTTPELDEGEEYYKEITPYIDHDSGEITFITSKRNDRQETDDSGEVKNVMDIRYYAVTADRDMKIVDKKELALERDSFLSSGVMTKDVLYYETEDYDEEHDKSTVYLCGYNLATGEIRTSTPVNDMFLTKERGWIYIERIAADTDGNIYLGQGQEICVVDSELERQYGIQLDDYVDYLYASPDGRVFTIQYTSNGCGLYEIDKENRRLRDEPVYTSDTSIDVVLFGGEGEMYITGSDGLYVKSGDGEAEILLNYMNSDIDGDHIKPLAVFDRDTVLAQERDMESDGSFGGDTVVLYKKSEDVDLSKIKTLDIAFPSGVDLDVKPIIVSYNRQHKDTRINVVDYSEYKTREDRLGGFTRFGTDLANGILKPDIIFLSTYNCDKIRKYIIDNNLFVDYNEVLADRPEILEDMFGGAKRALSTSDGRMWGITKQLTVSTLITDNASLLDRSTWTLDEMLDFNDSLPEGVALLDKFSRDYFFTSDASLFYESFVNMEKYTCDFENETFYRLLEYIVGLPTEEEKQQEIQNDDDMFAQYHTGKVELCASEMYEPSIWMMLQAVFNTNDYNPIGYPTDTGYGSFARPDGAYVITSWCGDVDMAWDFIENMVTVRDLRKARRLSGLPAFKSVFNIICDDYINNRYVFEIFFGGGTSTWNLTEGADMPEKSRKPGIITAFTEEDRRSFSDFLENRVGGMLAASIPEEVMEIIGEEVSAYAAGVNDAESCAEKIQSRVTIWLSEHEQ